eukprot:235199-Chlamydomonas_euryale.AAC.2
MSARCNRLAPDDDIADVRGRRAPVSPRPQARARSLKRVEKTDGEDSGPFAARTNSNLQGPR